MSNIVRGVGVRAILVRAWIAASLAMAGCGGGSGGSDPPGNAAPTASAGGDQVAHEGANVVLTGTGQDRDGVIRSYQWAQLSGPRVDLDDAAAAATEFTAPEFAEGQSELVFRLTVTDDAGATGTDETTVTINARPTASAGPDQTVDENQRVRLNAGGEDRDGSIESYAWTQVSGASVELGDATAAVLEFRAPEFVEGQSELVFRLTVTDNHGATATDEVTVGLIPPEQLTDDPFADEWNGLEPEPWWRESAPYSCAQARNRRSPWLDAGLIDLGGADPLSLIRYFGNGSYLRYGHQGFSGCTPVAKYPGRVHLDPPADPTYYSLGDLEIHVDLARVPTDATGWFRDDGARVDFGLDQAVELLNTYVAAYFRRISADRLRIAFQPGHEFDVRGDGSPAALELQHLRLLGACLNGCNRGTPGGLNRILLNDVAADTGGRAYNGLAYFGLVSLRDGNMETIVHEMGHAWMAWPHSYAEIVWRPQRGGEIDPPNPYSNFYDLMSSLDFFPTPGWGHDLPFTLAVNRYTAGWIPPEDVALHLTDEATYRLSEPTEPGNQFLVIHSGRRHAFTTLEVLEERAARFRVEHANVYDPAAPGNRRPRRYEGVLVSRYDQTVGTGLQARFGPAMYDRRNPDFLTDVHWARDDFSLLSDGEERDIGSGVGVSAAKNADGSWNVTVSGGRVAEFETWCMSIWFSRSEYDTGCFLDTAEWE